MAQYAEPETMFMVDGLIQLGADQDISLLLQRLMAGNRVGQSFSFWFSERPLMSDGSVDIHALKILQIFFLQKFEVALGVSISIQKQSAVGGMIMLFMKILEVGVRQVGRTLRVSPRFISVWSGREKGMSQLAVNTTFRTGELAFHLIQHHPFINNFTFRAVQFIMPAFLLEGFL